MDQQFPVSQTDLTKNEGKKKAVPLTTDAEVISSSASSTGLPRSDFAVVVRAITDTIGDQTIAEYCEANLELTANLRVAVEEISRQIQVPVGGLTALSFAELINEFAAGKRVDNVGRPCAPLRIAPVLTALGLDGEILTSACATFAEVVLERERGTQPASPTTPSLMLMEVFQELCYGGTPQTQQYAIDLFLEMAERGELGARVGNTSLQNIGFRLIDSIRAGVAENAFDTRVLWNNRDRFDSSVVAAFEGGMWRVHGPRVIYELKEEMYLIQMGFDHYVKERHSDHQVVPSVQSYDPAGDWWKQWLALEPVIGHAREQKIDAAILFAHSAVLDDFLADGRARGKDVDRFVDIAQTIRRVRSGYDLARTMCV